jgi:hypothetical protein
MIRLIGKLMLTAVRASVHNFQFLLDNKTPGPFFGTFYPPAIFFIFLKVVNEVEAGREVSDKLKHHK